jgi:hypothetical protein
MPTEDRDSQLLISALAEEAQARAGGHPDLEVLADYLAGRLDGQAEDRLRDHFVACRSCTTTLLDLETLAAPTPIPEGDVVDLERVAAWRELGSRVTPFDRPPRTLVARLAPALAAALAVVAIGLAGWVASLRQTIGALTAAQANPPILYLEGAARSRGEVDETFALEPAPGFVVLVVTPPQERLFDRYTIELSAAGRTLSTTSGLELSDHGTLRLGLSRERLAPGDYELRVLGVDGKEGTLLEVLPLRLRHP